MKIIFVLYLVFPALVCADEFTDYIAYWEGFSASAYNDSVGKRTIGYGFNLDRRDARTILGNKFSLYYHNICNMSQTDALRLLQYDVINCTQNVQQLVKTYNNQPKEVQLILVDMTYNLGVTGFSKFIKFRKAIEIYNYKQAAQELINSTWYKQVGRRSKHHVKILNKL